MQLHGSTGTTGKSLSPRSNPLPQRRRQGSILARSCHCVLESIQGVAHELTQMAQPLCHRQGQQASRWRRPPGDVVGQGQRRGRTPHQTWPGSTNPAACLLPAGCTANRPARGWGCVRRPPQPRGGIPDWAVAKGRLNFLYTGPWAVALWPEHSSVVRLRPAYQAQVASLARRATRPGAYRWLLDRDLRLRRHQDDAVGAALVNQQIPLPG
jgi:hypothetical protein